MPCRNQNTASKYGFHALNSNNNEREDGVDLNQKFIYFVSEILSNLLIQFIFSLREEDLIYL
jgi:hypothetical protein